MPGYPHRNSPVDISHNGHFRSGGDGYEAAMRRTFDAVRETATGGRLFDAVVRSGGMLFVHPSPTSTAARARAFVRTLTRADLRDGQATATACRSGARMVELCITPKHYTSSVDLRMTLVHELLHAVRFMTGCVRLDPLDGFGDREEFLATMVANVVSSEKSFGRFAYGYAPDTGMRFFRGYEVAVWREIDEIVSARSASGFGMSSGARHEVRELRGSEVRELSRRVAADAICGPPLAEFRQRNGDLCRELATVPADFNPFRDAAVATPATRATHPTLARPTFARTVGLRG